MLLKGYISDSRSKLNVFNLSLMWLIIILIITNIFRCSFCKINYFKVIITGHIFHYDFPTSHLPICFEDFLVTNYDLCGLPVVLMRESKACDLMHSEAGTKR